MRKKILLINFIVSCCIGATIYCLQKAGWLLPFIIHNYVNDFLILPIVLTLCLYVLRKTRRQHFFTINVFIIAYLVVLYSLFFEWYLPKVNVRYTADVLDVCMYVFGGCWFGYLQRCDVA